MTARTEEEDLLKGFEALANDYLTKPFSARELKARTKNALRTKDLLDTLGARTRFLELQQEITDKLESRRGRPGGEAGAGPRADPRPDRAALRRRRRHAPLAAARPTRDPDRPLADLARRRAPVLSRRARPLGGPARSRRPRGCRARRATRPGTGSSSRRRSGSARSCSGRSGSTAAADSRRGRLDRARASRRPRRPPRPDAPRADLIQTLRAGLESIGEARRASAGAYGASPPRKREGTPPRSSKRPTTRRASAA